MSRVSKETAMAKAKVPKRVAGVKVPRKARSQAKKALKLTGSRAVRDLALTGLTLAAEAMVESARRGRKAGKSSLDSLDLGEIMRAAAAEGARRFLESFEEAKPAGGRAQPRPRPPRPKAKAAKRAS
jgi:hypothetical protein